MIEGPYKLSKGWRWVRLNEITKVLESGKRPKGGVKNIANGIPSIGGEHITWDGGFDFANIRYVPYEFYQSMRKGKINKGDILIVKDGATTGKTAYVSEDFPFKDACINEHVYILRIYENLAISQFVFLFLMSSSGQTQLKNTFHGAAQGGINSEFINQVTIPLPPLEEQKRIVARVEELMSRIKEVKKLREETKKQTELLWQSVLAETFPQPGTQLPKGWRWVRLGEVAKIFSGSSAPQGKQYFEGGTYPFVRVQDLGRYRITDDLRETVDKVNEHAIKKLRLVKAKKGSIVFPKSGAAILTNSRAILGIDAYVVSHLAIVEPNYTKVDNRWIFYYLCSVDMAKFIDNPSYPSLRLSKIKEIHIPLPPLEEQKRIANYLLEVHEKIKELKEVQTRTEEEIKLLEQSILEKAFLGEL